VALFRAGHDDAFRVIHDRYRQRLFAYTRQMLTQRQDAEDALQDIFVRAYAGLRANHRELALRAWLYRVAHNRCIDELRRPSPPPPEVLELLRSPAHDPIAEADQRESLRRLIADVRRLPEQQRSALLMRELGGMSYADMAGALGVTVPAVKSLLVRARLALAKAVEARDTACSEIREELIISHDRGLRPNATARRHMRDCAGCRDFRHQLRGVSRRFAAIVPTLGPLGALANVLGIGGAGSGAAGGALAAGAGAGGGSAVVGIGAMSASATHVATLLAAAAVTAGGAVELQRTITGPVSHSHHRAHAALVAPATRHVTSSAAGSSSSVGVDPPEEAAPVAASPAPETQAIRIAATSPQEAALSTPTTVTTSTTTVKIPSKLKSKSTGGSSTMISGGGATPSGDGTTVNGQGDGTTSMTTGTSSSSTTSTGVTSSSSTGSSSTTPPDPASGSTTSSSSATSSPGDSSTGTGSAPGTSPTGTPPPAP
jgi:RNA polymerase sigma factor (sigma-70 family)